LSDTELLILPLREKIQFERRMDNSIICFNGEGSSLNNSGIILSYHCVKNIKNDAEK
jgi:hypothetical protein